MARWGGLLGRGVYRFVIPPVCPVCLAHCRPEHGAICEECDRILSEMQSPRCPGCGGELDGVLAQCGDCLSESARPWVDAVSVFRFRDIPRKLVHRFKYGGCTYLAAFLGLRMAANWREHGAAAVDLVVPVPLHWRRLWSRGYNQAGFLADVVGEALDLPVRNALRRVHATDRQALLDINHRRRNITGAFHPRSKQWIEGRDVLLIDDVITTGSTLSEAVEALLDGGARSVAILTCARG